jgi:transglutaminase/protease-like cytokinesis protein 3
MRKILVVIFLLSPFLVLSQKKTATEIAREITVKTTNDSLKVRRIYEWITDNIYYDVEYLEKLQGYDPDFQKSQSPEAVLKKKKAVCYGYSNLFNEMCKAVNVESHLVLGNCKDNLEYNGPLVFSENGHAWNAVFLNKRWYLLDVTWSSGALNSKGEYTQKRNETFYLSDGKKFTKDHIPNDPIWQLMDRPVTYSAFKFNREGQEGSTIGYFNSRDSLRNFRLQDETTRRQKYIDRSLKFNPKNDQIRLAAAYELAQKGFDFITFQNKNMALYQSVKNVTDAQKVLQTKVEYFDKLSLGITEMTKAKVYYNSIERSSRFFGVAQTNVRNMDDNLASLKTTRDQMTKFFADIERIYLKKTK